MEVKKPKWFDSWIEIDESYLKVAGTSWRLKANAPKKVKREYQRLLKQITGNNDYPYSWKHER
ncbi:MULTISPECIES: hypothetical protein [Mesotoga]|uniref:Uncharacterized protein n=1 Tax=Mesotoga prima MesG1.Ag.4.2 TaxID=660470 RepID=I2F443_9BACT|nr:MULTISPECIES: hypothetical protein [Mesotoga]MCP5456677.1 hypothetical protein [Thermotogota bacterium]AFK06696.1 hypothetical protein Theba_0990 [Mesotoga prima MesG1.Ag.4.2]MCB1224024.1 hypothetical protein [Mesotoga sp.]PIJ62469.1 hypothetical protein V513_07625 [Mesotoga sp. H07.pep.5.3]RLL86875.1 hypothetical protein Y696_01985 [Mesotoga sp. H07pep.5.4]